MENVEPVKSNWTTRQVTLSKEVAVTYLYGKEAKGPGTWKGYKDIFNLGGGGGGREFKSM